MATSTTHQLKRWGASDSYVEDEALVGGGAEREAAAKVHAPQEHHPRRGGRQRVRRLRRRRHGHRPSSSPARRRGGSEIGRKSFSGSSQRQTLTGVAWRRRRGIGGPAELGLTNPIPQVRPNGPILKIKGISSPEVPQLNNEIFGGPLTTKPEMCTPKLTQTVHRRSLGNIFARFC